MTKISLTYSRTVNLGNYNSGRLEIGIEEDLNSGQTKKEKIDELWKMLQGEVVEKLDIKPQLPYKPGSVIGGKRGEPF